MESLAEYPLKGRSSKTIYRIRIDTSRLRETNKRFYLAGLPDSGRNDMKKTKLHTDQTEKKRLDVEQPSGEEHADVTERTSRRKKGANSGDGSQTEEKAEFSLVREALGMLVYIAFVIVVVWCIVTFVGQRTEVSGRSMYDTLDDKDSLWIDKLSYRFHDPERFDIVVFPYQGGSVYYIKRIIGLPGETVRIDEEGTIYINDEPLDEDYGYEVISPYMIGRTGENVLLGEDEYFVMGDNRNDSKDSRFESVGNIKREDLKGKAVFRLWPLSKFGKIE